jgi:8-oxo-dGTP pyrophosphatase MutT (NUDIX family)
MPELQDAAVLVPLFRDDRGALRLVLVRRGEGGIHGGQLAFPGGRREAADRTPLDTAVREACEETGLTRDAIEVVDSLPVIETRTTGFRIAPFLARVRPPDPWRPAEGEIAEVLDVRVDDLALPDTHGEALEQFAGWPEPRRIPFYRVGPHRLWGATYRILHPLIPRLTAGEWKL